MHKSTLAFLPLATLAAATLALSGCGHSDKAGDAASTDTVEMPAEEAMSGVEPTATPTPDPSATATDAATDVASTSVDTAPTAAATP